MLDIELELHNYYNSQNLEYMNSWERSNHERFKQNKLDEESCVNCVLDRSKFGTKVDK